MSSEAETNLLLYVLFFGVGLIFTMLAVVRKTTILNALTTFLWFNIAVVNLGISPVSGVMQLGATIFYFGLALIFFVLTFISAFNDLKMAAERKRSVDVV